jgi:hypothetical protein
MAATANKASINFFNLRFLYALDLEGIQKKARQDAYVEKTIRVNVKYAANIDL